MKTAQIWDTIHVIGAGIGAFCGWYLGSLDGVLYVLIACTIADYLSGLACAFVKKELSSEIGAKGIAKKVMIYILIGIGLCLMNIYSAEGRHFAQHWRFGISVTRG